MNDKPQTAQEAIAELLELLRQAQSLGLRFDIGSAYIRRSYIDAQTELNARIDAARARLAA
jgi:hypothetical protein